MKRTILVSWLLLLFPVTCFSLPGQALDAQEMKKSCGKFVQSFYDWYAQGLMGSDPDLLERAIKHKPTAFNAELLRQIKDSKKRAWANEEVWLDFEPILNTQDASQHYVAGEVDFKGEDTCLVKVYAGRAGKNQKIKPTVVPELTLKDGQWLFVNFHYPNSNHPDNESLVAMLEKILKEPKTPSK